jgi:hypothetical protein
MIHQLLTPKKKNKTKQKQKQKKKRNKTKQIKKQKQTKNQKQKKAHAMREPKNPILHIYIYTHHVSLRRKSAFTNLFPYHSNINIASSFSTSNLTENLP